MRWGAVLTMLLLVSGTVLAQDRGVGGTAAAVAGEPQKWAVVIGVGKYADPGIGALPKAVNDAVAVRKMLATMPDGFPEGNVILLADTEGPDRAPTRANIMRFLKSKLTLVAKDDTVLVYFAGHGTTDEGALYLLPSDASLNSVKFTGFPFSELEKLLQDAPAKKKILIMDACHSGTGRGTETMDKRAISEIEKASQGMVTLASCSGEELSHDMPNTEHGAFTYFLLDGMSGKADKDGDGYLSASELSTYTWDATRRWASDQGLQQTPWRMEKVAGEIILAKAGGAVPLLENSAASATTQTVEQAPPAAVTPSTPEQRFCGTWQSTSDQTFKLMIDRVDGQFQITWTASSCYTLKDVRLDGNHLVFLGAYEFHKHLTNIKWLLRGTLSLNDSGTALIWSDEILESSEKKLIGNKTELSFKRLTP